MKLYFPKIEVEPITLKFLFQPSWKFTIILDLHINNIGTNHFRASLADYASQQTPTASDLQCKLTTINNLMAAHVTQYCNHV